jgi:superfamily II DNA or RNA helicase
MQLYPELDDPEFHKKIFEKEEYQSTQYPVDYYETVSLEDKCNAQSFNVENHQVFLSRFMSPDTPYKSVLLFHGVGTGKTCAALTIAEGYKKTLTNLRKRLQVKRGTRNFVYYNYPGVYVISSRAIHKVFRNELYNTNKVPREEAPGMMHCLGNEYFPVNDDSEGANQKLQVSRKILSYYSFFGPSEFSNFVRDIKKITNLQDFFSHSIFIVDEVHNVLSEEKEIGDSKNNTLETLKEVFKEASDTRLVMLSATPMRDDEESIINLLTLLRYNDDKYEEIQKDKLFPKGNNVNHSYLSELARGYVSYLRGNNPVSFPEMVMPLLIYKPNPTLKINGEPYVKDDRMYELFKCEMSEFQYSFYIKLKEDYGLQHIKLREAATIVYPSGDIGDTGFDKSFKSNKGIYSFINENFLLEQNVEKYSKKIYELLKIARTQKGLHYIYSLFDKSGALTIALAFEANGYAFYSKEGNYDPSGRFVGGKKLLSNMKNARCAICGNLQQEDHIDHKFKQGTFILFTGSETAGVQDALQVYNSIENKDGHLIKFVIGSLVSAEGVDYKRIKHLHVINPWYNFTRTWQAIGRGLRNCSQADFPEGERNVVVYLYSSTSSDNVMETIDEQMYRLSLEKDIRIKDIERTLKSVSIDCFLNKEANNYASDKDYTRECDYKECSFECSFEPADDKITNRETFNIQTNDPEIRKASNLIFLLFKKKGFYKLEEIIDSLKSFVDEEYLFIALTRYITKKHILKDKYSRDGFMVYKNGYYFYQPNEFDDIEAPVRYKQTPLKLKTSTITVVAPPKVSKTFSVEKEKEKEPVIIDENAIRNILLQPTLELMMYYFDSYNEKTILMITDLLLKKGYNEETKILQLLEYLNSIGFVLAEPYDAAKHNEELYWNNKSVAYVGRKAGYWSDNNNIFILTPTGTMAPLTSIAKISELLDYNEVKGKKLSSQYEKGCYLHGIISYKEQREFKILYNPTQDSMKAADKRKKSTGKSALSYPVGELKKFMQCLDSSIDAGVMNKNILVKEIELELRRKSQNNEGNFMWLIRNKK